VTQLAVLGAGSWGTALAIALCPRFSAIRIWAHEPKRAAEMMHFRENRSYLPGFALPENVSVSPDLGATLTGADVVLGTVPSTHLRHIMQTASPLISGNPVIVCATKGIEEETLQRMSQVIAEALEGLPERPIAVISGPTFAKEIAAGEPAAVVVAAQDIRVAERVQRAFATPSLRLYTSGDIVGVELGAALKNVVAIGAGICRGLGLGSNSVAALITRGLAEITRLAVRMGGDARTLSGLAGLGDLVVTATGDLSRNRYVGIQLGQGRKLNEILAGMTMVAEGISTCRAAHQLGLNENVDLPIIAQMHAVLYENREPRHAIRDLMDRPLTNE
jgi:glycerol-3-phosphate dehydrogenase (NAD(P)+)